MFLNIIEDDVLQNIDSAFQEHYPYLKLVFEAGRMGSRALSEDLPEEPFRILISKIEDLCLSKDHAVYIIPLLREYPQDFPATRIRSMLP